MSITDLLPWRKKKKTKVPVKVQEQPIRIPDLEMSGSGDGLSRWSGIAPLGVFGDWMDLFGPRMDMVEDSEGFWITIEVPGMARDDIDVTLSGDRLTVRGARQDEEEQRGRSTYRLHRSQPPSLSLPHRRRSSRGDASQGGADHQPPQGGEHAEPQTHSHKKQMTYRMARAALRRGLGFERRGCLA